MTSSATQTTLGRPVRLSGDGLHLGTATTVELRPAPADTGVVFHRDGHDGAIRVGPDQVVHTLLATTLGNGAWSVCTVEHLLAALLGCGVDNVAVHIDGDEIPAVDGSARPWVELVDAAGVVALDAPRRFIEIVDVVEVRDGDRWARLSPAPRLELWARIDFAHPGVGVQELEVPLVNGEFRHELAWARTFGFVADVERMRAMGLGQGGGLHNAVVYGDDGPLNPEGLRAADEPLRHKLLDMVGDLALLGLPVRGRLEAERPGHALTVALLAALRERPSTWRVVSAATGG